MIIASDQDTARRPHFVVAEESIAGGDKVEDIARQLDRRLWLTISLVTAALGFCIASRDTQRRTSVKPFAVESNDCCLSKCVCWNRQVALAIA